jgi:N-acetylglutamate synthase-like GNAT family acetyltransferase
MEVRVRAAGPEDAEVIVQVYVDSWNAGFGSRMRVIDADASRIERWRNDLSDATPTRWWLAEAANTVPGFVGIGPSREPIDPTLGELDTIAVHPDAWHSGVGKQLMEIALEELRADGYRAAILWTLNRYPLGERFYIATGWSRTEITRNDGDQIRYDYDLPVR